MKQTHKTRLLDYLSQYKSITSLEAIRDLGNTRLSSTIHKLRSDGHPIETKSIKVPTRWGTTSNVAQYILKK